MSLSVNLFNEREIMSKLMDGVLESLRTSKEEVAVYLNSSIRIVGKVLEYDETHIQMSDKQSWCMINRLSIATLKPYMDSGDYQTPRPQIPRRS